MNQHYEAFRKKLQEIFMMDHAELDFGIYRIMNHKRNQINDFLDKQLLPQVEKTLQEYVKTDDTLQQELTKAIEGCKNLGIDPDTNPKVQQLRQQIAQSSTSIDDLQNTVFSRLTQFFSRYYEGGDFVSQRRYKTGGNSAYAIPYNGEEVKLYWANYDQYYIKTSEYFKNYTFKLRDGRRICFVLVDASTEQNNNKNTNGMERRFDILRSEEGQPVVEEVEGELHISFTYELMPKATKQKDLNEKAFEALSAVIPAAWQDLLMKEQVTDENVLLKKHINAYTAKNSFDYFIHKDLGGFLSRELDFYIKNEVFVFADLDTAKLQSQLAVVKAIEKVGQKIIDFLAQLENFQKRLWLKKKFVVQSDYCITLDRVPEKFYPEICANDEQRKEWVRLFAIDEIEGDGLFTTGYSEPLTVDFLKQNPFLVLDTKFFSVQFKHKMLAEIEDLDEQTNGLMVNSDNINLIRFIQYKYCYQISCVHIDPPYNTDTSGFLYKNNYRHSSWMSMMDERIDKSKVLLKNDASFICHIDENEYENLFKLFRQHDLHNLGTVVWDKRNPMTGGHGIALQHEYITWFSPSDITISTNTESARLILEKAKVLIEKYGKVNDELRTEFRSWLNSNVEIEGGDRAYNNIDDKGRVYQSVSLRAPEPRTDPKFHKPLIHPVTGKPCPVPPNGFSRTPETMANMIERGDIIFGSDETTQPRYKMYLSYDTKKQMTSVIANAIKGKTELVKLGFDFPYCHSTTFYNTILTSCVKSNEIVLDYFAGSGTTGHTIIDINRNSNLDLNNLRYILCEVGTYFESVTKPRIEKAIYSEDWNEGKPVSRKGVSQCFKYIRLEQYEDTLNNLEVNDGFGKPDNESYVLRYMLDTETRDSLINTKDFVRPFDYTIKTTRDNELVDTPVDLVDTFNYLIGLHVDSIHWHKDDNICVVEGTTHIEKEHALVIWRNQDVIKNDDLNDFFRKQDYSTLDREFDVIYVNGDNTLPNLKSDEEHWKVRLIEQEMMKRMFEEE